MNNLKNKELSRLGYTNDIARSLVVNTISKHFKHQSREEVITILSRIKDMPDAYKDDPVLGKIARTFMDDELPCNFKSFSLLEETGQLKIWGGKEIEHSAKKQMELAMSLPITVQGALMPDAHTGYGLADRRCAGHRRCSDPICSRRRYRLPDVDDHY